MTRTTAVTNLNSTDEQRYVEKIKCNSLTSTAFYCKLRAIRLKMGHPYIISQIAYNCSEPNFDYPAATFYRITSGINTFHSIMSLFMQLYIIILYIQCNISHTAYKMISLMMSTSTGIQLMFAHASYLLLQQECSVTQL